MSNEEKSSSNGTNAKTKLDTVRPSMSVRLIRHAESRNNEVYRNARYIYRGGTPDFDEAGWISYVNTHRSADPTLSTTGKKQAQKLADFLVPHLRHQASRPVHIITSPMRRTLETIRPTIEGLEQSEGNTVNSSSTCKILVNGFYFESEGCHTHEKPEEGMNPAQIRSLLENREDVDQNDGRTEKDTLSVEFTGFPNPARGWWVNGTGAETRAESEVRAAKFYVWLCENLDNQLAEHREHEDLFDAGVALPGEEEEDEHDKYAPRQRKRRTTLLIGHGDFMSLVLKRIVAGFGHYVENEGVPHRSAFTHFNTGITELEYFGQGRWLVMGHNQTPHFTWEEHSTLRTGGGLKDGWSYLVPHDNVLLNAEVSVAFSDEEIEEHVREQAEALKALYLSSGRSFPASGIDSSLSVEQDENESDQAKVRGGVTRHFIVKRGLQVVGVATYTEATGQLTDVAVRPSAGKEVSEALFAAVKKFSKQLGRSGSLLVMPRSDESRRLFEEMGFSGVGEESEHMEMEY